MDYRIKGFQCKKCKFKTTIRGWINAQLQIKNHFEDSHKDIIQEIEDCENWLKSEIQKLEEKVPQISLGNFISVIKSESAKKWKCPRCLEEISYGNKYYHQMNATRAGKDYQCIKNKTS